MVEVQEKLSKMTEDLNDKESELIDTIAQLNLNKDDNSKLESEVKELSEQRDAAVEKASKAEEECLRLSSDNEGENENVSSENREQERKWDLKVRFRSVCGKSGAKRSKKSDKDIPF